MNSFFNKYNSLDVTVKAAFWFTICSFFQKGISFITVPIFTRLLSTEEYGIFSLYLSWLQVFSVLTSLYLYNGVTDNAMSKFEQDRSRFISSMQGLTVSITTCFFLLAILLINYLSQMMKLVPVMILLMFAEMYVTPAFAFWSTRQRFEYNYKRLVGITLAKSILNPVLGLIAVSVADDKAIARVISTLIIEIMICGPIMIFHFIRGKVYYDQYYWKYAITLAIPLLPHYLSGIILSHGDRIMISNLIGKSEVALYSVAYNIGMLIQLFVSAINCAITPWVYSKLKEADIQSIRIKSRGIMIFVFFVTVALMLVSPELVLIFGSSKYADSVFVIPPVAGSVFFFFMYGFLSFPEFYYEKTSFLMSASLVAAGLNTILNYFFIPIYGFIAAAYTTLACYVMYSLGHYIIGKRVLQKETGENSIVDNSLALLLAITLIIISSFIYHVFPYTVIRYAIIFFMGGIALSSKEIV